MRYPALFLPFAFVCPDTEIPFAAAWIIYIFVPTDQEYIIIGGSLVFLFIYTNMAVYEGKHNIERLIYAFIDRLEATATGP